MPNIHGSLLHLPKPPPRGKFHAAGAKFAGGAKSGAKKGHDAFKGAAPGMKNKFRSAVGNATSHRASTPGGEKIGARPEDNTDVGRGSIRLNSGYGALGAGLLAGTGAGELHGRHKYPESKKFNQVALGKALGGGRAFRITDVGTAAGKYNMRRWPEMPRKTMITAGAAGTAAGYAGGMGDKKAKANYVKQQQKKKGSLTAVAKKQSNPWPDSEKGKLAFNDEGGRARFNQTAKQNYSMFKGPHRAKNAKTQAKYTAGGAALGAGALGAVARGSGEARGFAALGGLIGAGYGAVGGSVHRSVRASKETVRSSYKKGDVRAFNDKKETVNSRGVIVGKSASVSAFGVDHG